MADKKITALTALTSAATDDLLVIVDDVAGTPTTKKITVANLITLIKAQLLDETYQQLTDAASISWSLASGRHAYVTLTDNRAMGTPSDLKKGPCFLIVIQDATGSRTLDLSDGTFKFPGGTEPSLSTAANSVDIIEFFCDGTSLYGVANHKFS